VQHRIANNFPGVRFAERRDAISPARGVFLSTGFHENQHIFREAVVPSCFAGSAGRSRVLRQ